MPANLENSAMTTGLGKVNFHSNPKERQCQRKCRLLNNCTHLTHYQSNAQNFPSQTSTVCELINSRQSSWIQKRQRDQRPNCQHGLDHRKKIREFQKNVYFCFIDYPKVFHYVDHNKLWKILKELGIPEHLTCLLRNLYAGQKATVRTGRGQQTVFILGKDHVKAVYCHPVYLTYLQSISCEMLRWLKHKLESRLPGEISITSVIQMIPSFQQKAKRN